MKTSDIDRTICLLHESRYKNKKYISNLGKRVGLHIEFFLVGNKDSKLALDRIDSHSSKHANINLSHQAIVCQAKNDGCKNLLMLEDDVTFTKDFVEVLDKINLEENCAGINLGGYSEYPHIQNKHYHMEELLITPYRMWGLFGTLINRFAFDWYIMYNPETRSSHLDNILSDYSNDRELILTKPIIVERPMFSLAINEYKPSPLYDQAMKEGRLWKDEEILSDMFDKTVYSKYKRKYPKFLWNKRW
jgi:GR25 family glycosyltransferase involved in LPS biosynthesis